MPNRDQKMKGRRRKSKAQSPIIRLCNLMLKVYKQPFGLPTPDQFPDIKRLNNEVGELLEYRRTHRDWRTNDGFH